tara:strand:- start:100 stop:693 length:594 start_codon:yes stop_codon:yes gene_type:complete
MGSNSASTGGGGGGVGPAGIKTDGTYGTKKDAKKVSRRNEFRTFVKEGGVVGAIIKGVTGKTVYERNLERRQKFIKSKGLTGDDINMDASYLGSKEGLAELKKQGYTTAADVSSGRDDGGNQVAQTTTMAAATAPTTAEVSQSSATDATDVATVDTDDPTYIKRKNKRVGRSLTILTSSKGATDGLTLGKRSLLGQA